MTIPMTKQVCPECDFETIDKQGICPTHKINLVVASFTERLEKLLGDTNPTKLSWWDPNTVLPFKVGLSGPFVLAHDYLLLLKEYNKKVSLEDDLAYKPHETEEKKKQFVSVGDAFNEAAEWWKEEGEEMALSVTTKHLSARAFVWGASWGHTKGLNTALKQWVPVQTDLPILGHFVLAVETREGNEEMYLARRKHNPISKETWWEDEGGLTIEPSHWREKPAFPTKEDNL